MQTIETQTQTLHSDHNSWTYGDLRASTIITTQNPRRRLNADNLEQIIRSMKQNGQLEEVIVRLVPSSEGDQYVLAAGGHRVAAAIAVQSSPDALVKAKWKVMTDAEFAAIAQITNTDRAPMTPLEQAEAAEKLLGKCNGNKEAAAAMLGLSPEMFKRRLALTYAVEEVRNALDEGKIELGHAELIAVLRQPAQVEAIKLLLSSSKLMTVVELKAYTSQAAAKMAEAIFAKDDCASCHHNTENQQALFGEAVATGHCTNLTCYQGKTEDALNAKAKALGDEYQTVRIVRPGEKLTMAKLTVNGDKSVGPEQAANCRMCKDFGAVVSGLPSSMGRTFIDMCMNTACNAEKVAAYAQSQMPQQAPVAPPPVSSKASDSPTSSAGKDKREPSGKAGETGVLTSIQPSNRIKEYREKQWRAMFSTLMTRVPVQQNRWVLIALCMTRPGVLDASALRAHTKTLIGDVGHSTAPVKVVEHLASLTDPQIRDLTSLIAAHVSSGQSGLEIQHVIELMQFFEVKVSDHWQLNKDFLDLLTKNEIDFVCGEVGIKSAMGNAYGKAKGGSKEEFVKAVLEVKGFTYKGAVPSVMKF